MSKLGDARTAKDAFFRSSQSPLSPPQRKTFKGLNYFSENPALRIETRLHTYATAERVSMPTSTGHNADFLKYGCVEFELNGHRQSLQVYDFEDADSRFLPFMDATGGQATYGDWRI